MVQLVFDYKDDKVQKKFSDKKKNNTITGIPRLTRFLWQPKIRVTRNWRYENHSIAGKNVTKNSIIIYYKIHLLKSA